MKKGCIGLVLLLLVINLVYAQDEPYAADAQGKCSTATDGVKIGGYCYDCGKNDGVCPEDFSSGICGTKADIDCCKLTAVKWTNSQGTEITNANGGDSVKLVLEASAKCKGQSVSFDISESDQLSGNDDYPSDPSSTTIGSDGKASVSWNVDGTFSDGLLGGGPEFIFDAIIANTIIFGPSSELAISGSGGAPTTTTAAAACGDGVLDSGETPENCPSDAGCDNGLIYCGSDEGCLAACNTPANDNGDSNCDADESCATASCNGLQSTCMSGLTCANNVCSCNSLTKDGILPPMTSVCAAYDPDYDIDGDGVMGGDNCPGVANADQADFDSDGSICDYTTVPYVSSTGFACGGDLCDLDEDNDGVCNAGETSSYCTGSDLCLGTDPNVDISTVDKDGCTEDQKDCLAQWDCTQAAWSECDTTTNTITRDTSKCVFTGPQGSICQTNTVYQPEAIKSCLVEEEFPVFGLMNILVTLVLIAGFYWIRR